MDAETSELKDLNFHQRIWKVAPRGCPKDLVIKFACEATGIDEELFFSRSRRREAVMARQIAMTYVCANRYLKDMRLIDIGGMFGGYDHATVVAARKSVLELVETKNPQMTEAVKRFIRQIVSYSYEYSTIMKSDEWSHKKKEEIEPKTEI